MTTPRTRAIVSLAATIALTLPLASCAHGPSRPAAHATAVAAGRPPAIRFDNGGRERVLVYLIGEEREWFLGRVEPGARTLLPVPNVSLTGQQGFVRLAVLPGERLTPLAARDARATVATTTIAQPASAILLQRFTFEQGQLTSLRRSGAPAGLGRP